ncbi:MAG: transposase [Nitrospirae bacterium]|nr:transposase [Magnetococcales bacterium]HAT50514.1 integrase [Alphaproteobacteria bacterium]
MGIGEVITAPGSPWQNPYCDRFIGSIRHKALDHIIPMNEKHLRRTLSIYLAYHHGSRTHLGLARDCPSPRPVQTKNAEKIVAFPHLG